MRRSSHSPVMLLPIGLMFLTLTLWGFGVLSAWVPAPPAFFVPLLKAAGLGGLVLVAVAYAIRRWKRSRLLGQAGTLAALHKLSWAQFELVVGEAYRRHGWRVEETGQGGADGGVDLLMKKGSKRCIVQVKHWQARVGAPVVREMFGLMVHHKADRVAIVALGGFTSEAIDFAQGKAVDLVDGKGLLALAGGQLPEAVTAPAQRSSRSEEPRKKGAPKCPTCQSQMVRRVRKQDASMFWGCSRYPGCTGTRNIRS